MDRKNVCLAAFAILIVATYAALARAEMQVIESNVGAFDVGARIADVDTTSLPPGGRVKVLILPSNETKVFRGPGTAEGNAKNTPFGGTRGPPAKLQK